MKLILTQEVTGLGGPGDVVEVKDGYGRNYLVPRGAAIRWTRGGEKQVASIKRGREVREIRDLGHASEVKAQLEALTVKLPVPRRRRRPAVRLGHRRRHRRGRRKAPAARTSTSAGSRSATPIKTVGAHQVTVRLHPEVAATVDRRGRRRGLTVPRRTTARPPRTGSPGRRASGPPTYPGPVIGPDPARRPRMAGVSAPCEAQVPREVPTGLAQRRPRRPVWPP